MERESPSYKAFWPEFVSQHQRKANRDLHFVGTALAAFCLWAALFEEPWFLPGVPFFGLGFAWIGHHWVEKNQPATFRHPLWSLVAHCHMIFLMCLGRMQREVRRMDILLQA